MTIGSGGAGFWCGALYGGEGVMGCGGGADGADGGWAIGCWWLGGGDCLLWFEAAWGREGFGDGGRGASWSWGVWTWRWGLWEAGAGAVVEYMAL